MTSHSTSGASDTSDNPASPHWRGAIVGLSLEARSQVGGSRRCCGRGCSSKNRPFKKHTGSKSTLLACAEVNQTTYHLDATKYADAPATIYYYPFPIITVQIIKHNDSTITAGSQDQQDRTDLERCRRWRIWCCCFNSVWLQHIIS